jgi:hypothetical protein
MGEILVRHHLATVNFFAACLTGPNSTDCQYDIIVIWAEKENRHLLWRLTMHAEDCIGPIQLNSLNQYKQL